MEDHEPVYWQTDNLMSEQPPTIARDEDERVESPPQVMILSTLWIVLIGFWRLPGLLARRLWHEIAGY